MGEKCFRCGKPAKHSWSICADGNKLRHVCIKCDVELNTVVLIFMGFRDWKSKIAKYKP